ncbi:MAG: hypothetical protein Fur002_08330 [Anaerolineales bacterium]
MNTKNLQKHYDKLTVKERFALIVAAGIRNDDQERAALLQSAPRKVFSYPHTNGLAEAFYFLATWHVMTQMGYAAAFYHLLAYDEIQGIKTDSVIISSDEMMTLIQRRILEGRGAWRAICQEYGIDPAKMLEGLPFIEMIEMTESIATAAAQIRPIELADLPKAIEGYKAAIEQKSKHWE